MIVVRVERVWNGIDEDDWRVIDVVYLENVGDGLAKVVNEQLFLCLCSNSIPVANRKPEA
jgi:hypothetical protein